MANMPILVNLKVNLALIHGEFQFLGYSIIMICLLCIRMNMFHFSSIVKITRNNIYDTFCS